LQVASVLKVSQAQRQHHPEPSAAMLEDAFEAVIGAIHIDGGIDAARGVILNLLADALQAAAQSDQQGNPKGRLQEWAQQHHDGIVPDYIALPEQGPDHARIYGAVVELQGQELGRGQGSSKKAAESAAAENALQQLNQ
jgi:ribonuclease-3